MNDSQRKSHSPMQNKDITKQMARGTLPMLSSSPSKKIPSRSVVLSPSGTEVVSDITDSDDDDPLVLLRTKKELKRKRKVRDLLLSESITSRPPPPRIIPTFARFDHTKIELLKKSKELTRLHKKDDEAALRIVKDEEDFINELEKKLHKDAFKDTKYVHFITSHRDELKLKDFYYLTQSENANTQPSPIYPLFAVELGISWLDEDQVLGELCIPLIQREIENLKDEQNVDAYRIRQFMKGLGVSDQTHEKQTVTESDFEFDTKHKRQPIPLVIAKMAYLVKRITLTPYSDELFLSIVKVFGFLMMDTRIVRSDTATELTELINDLFRWQYHCIKDLKLQLVVDTWLSLTEILEFNYRILSILRSRISPAIMLLRRLLALSFIVSDYPEITLSTARDQIHEIMFGSICGALKELNKHAPKMESEEFAQWMIKLKAIMVCVGNEKDDPQLKRMRSIVKELELSITTSYHDQSQSLCHSALLSLSSILGVNDSTKLANVRGT